MKKYRAVIFDWDGTVMDSTYSITHSIQLASEDMGLPVPSREKASWIIGLSIENGLYKIFPELDEKSLPEFVARSEEHTSELQSRGHLVCRLLLEKKKRET